MDGEENLMNPPSDVWMIPDGQTGANGEGNAKVQSNDDEKAGNHDQDVVDDETYVDDQIEDEGDSQSKYIGLEFDTFAMVGEFWERYGREVGFGGRIKSQHNSKKDGRILGITYLCSQAGKKAEDPRRKNSKRRLNTRCDCPVKLVIGFNRVKEKYFIKYFNENHNHDLEGKGTVHLIRKHRKINQVQACSINNAYHSGLGPTAIHRFMTVEAGGTDRVGFTIEEVKSHLRTKRLKNLDCGEATAILSYFDKQCRLSPTFFRRTQLDCEGMITNFFWADSKMLIDYQVFGDVLTFDTIFGTNNESRPLRIFTGFNNHRQTVIFGAILLYDETAVSFAWAFSMFLECHGGKLPGIISTDQDPAIKKALELVMPNVRHGLCSWHISQNAIKNLSGILRENMRKFLHEFHECMYEYLDIDTFEQKWKAMLENFNLAGNNWLNEHYKNKEKWCLAYMKNVFTAGIRSTQLSECVNSRLKKDLRRGLSMERFFIGFDLFLMGVREKESKSDCKSRQTSPHLAAQNCSILKHAAQNCSILKHAAKIYTPNMYDIFYKEWDLEHGISMERYLGDIGIPHMRVAKQSAKSYEINVDLSTMTFSCNCSRYEMRGYLCAHILRIFRDYDIYEIPEKYILKRWTKGAKSELVSVDFGMLQSHDLSEIQKYDILCSRWEPIARRACQNDIPFDEFVSRFLTAAYEYFTSYENSRDSINETNNCSSVDRSNAEVKGLKKKENAKSGRKLRFKSCLEKGNKGKKAKQANTRVPYSLPDLNF